MRALGASVKYIVFGTGGFAREVAWIVESAPGMAQDLLGFLDDNEECHGASVNGFPVLGGSEWLASYKGEIGVFLGLGSPTVRHKVARRLVGFTHVSFPTLIHPSVQFGRDVTFGGGCILCAGTILTCNIRLDDFVILNLDCTVGHDSRLGAFTTVAPGVHISGNVNVGSGSDLGTGSAIIQGVNIGDNVVIGAGAVLNRDIPDGATAVGVPGKVIKTLEAPKLMWP